MLDKLREIEEKYSEIERRMTLPEVYSDVAVYSKLAKDQKELMPFVETYRRYRKFADTADEAKKLLDAGSDEPEFKDLLREELEDAKQQMEKIEEELKVLLLPTDPNDSTLGSNVMSMFCHRSIR